MSNNAHAIRSSGAHAVLARLDRDVWCARGPVALMRARLVALGIPTDYLPDTPLLRLRETDAELRDLACVPDRHDDDTLWWAWLHPGPRAGAPPELEFICRATDPDSAEHIVRLLRAQ
ncbi:MAG: hypothetical protein L0Y54_11875 [Sporichthyaceae bacterium]|nr:hypothetical protein [Sporichthyaceae bacterium]